MIAWLDALNEVVVRIIHFAMLLAPCGVAALIFAVASRFGLDLLVAVAAFVLTVLFALSLRRAGFSTCREPRSTSCRT